MSVRSPIQLSLSCVFILPYPAHTLYNLHVLLPYCPSTVLSTRLPIFNFSLSRVVIRVWRKSPHTLHFFIINIIYINIYIYIGLYFIYYFINLYTRECL